MEYGFKGISTLLRKTYKCKFKKNDTRKPKNKTSILLFYQHLFCTANGILEGCKAHILMKITAQFKTKR